MFTRKWWRVVLDRAARSSAQGFLLAVGSTVPGWMALDWKMVAYATVGMGGLSFATSILKSPVPPEDTE